MGGEELEMASIIGNSFEKFYWKGETKNGTVTVVKVESKLTRKLGEIFVFDEKNLEEKEICM